MVRHVAVTTEKVMALNDLHLHTRSHPGQSRGSLRKKKKQQEKREALALTASTAGLSVTAYRQQQQCELNVLIAKQRAYVPKPKPVAKRTMVNIQMQCITGRPIGAAFVLH